MLLSFFCLRDTNGADSRIADMYLFALLFCYLFSE